MTPQSATAMQTTKGSVPAKQSPADLFEVIYDGLARRAFELFESNGRWVGNDLSDWFHAEAEVLHPIHLEMRESDDSFSVEAEVPGFTSRELEITVEPRSLRIAGKREIKEEKKKGKMIRSEWRANHILRTIDLPSEVDTSKVSSTLRDGMLTIELPKAPHAKPVRIEPRSI